MIIASPVARTVKNLPATRETGVWSLGGEDPLENEMATHSSFLAWRIPWSEESGRLQSTGLQSQTGLSAWHFALHFSYPKPEGSWLWRCITWASLHHPTRLCRPGDLDQLWDSDCFFAVRTILVSDPDTHALCQHPQNCGKFICSHTSR